jgi:hypothetical protein
VTVFKARGDRFLVARRTAEVESLWPAYIVRGTEVSGPEALGNFFRFIPADWQECAGPYPKAVQQVIDRVATVLDPAIAS